MKLRRIAFEALITFVVLFGFFYLGIRSVVHNPATLLGMVVIWAAVSVVGVVGGEAYNNGYFRKVFSRIRGKRHH